MKIISRPVFILGIVSLLTDLSTEMIYPILPLFMANTLGISTAFIGLVEGIAESTASILKIFSGWLSDKLGKRKALIFAGYGFSSIVKPFLALATTGWHVLGLRFLDRLGKGIRGAPRDAMIADFTEPSQRGRAFGFHRAMDTMGATIGPGTTFLLLLVFTNNNYGPIFWLATIPALLAVAVIIFFVRDKKSEAIRESVARPKISFRGMPRSFLVLLMITGIFTIGNSSDAFLILRAQNVGITASKIPLLWLFFNLIYALVSMPAGHISDKIGRKKVIILGFGIYSLSYLGFAFASRDWQIWLLFAIYGAYYGTTEGVIRAYIADTVPDNIRATSFGVYNFFTGVLLFPANLLTGFIWKFAGPTAAFGFGAVTAFIAMMGFILVAREK